MSKLEAGPVKSFRIGAMYKHIETGIVYGVLEVRQVYQRHAAMNTGRIDTMATLVVRIEDSYNPSEEKTLSAWNAKEYLEINMTYLPIELYNAYVFTMKATPQQFGFGV